MARWRFAGGTGTGGALKFPLTLPAGDYIYTTAEDGEAELSSAETIVIDQAGIPQDGLVALYKMYDEPAGSETQILRNQKKNTTTMKNELDYKLADYSGWTYTQVATIDSTGIELVNAESGSTTAMKDGLAIKPSTNYLLLYNIVSCDYAGIFYCCYASTRALTQTTLTKDIGNNKAVISSLGTIANQSVTLWNSGGTINGAIPGQKIKFKDIRLFELPSGSEIEVDANTMTADELNAKYPMVTDETGMTGSEHNVTMALNNGILGSTPSIDTNDPVFDGQSLVFAGDDYVDCGNSDALNDIEKMTFECVFYAVDYGGNNYGRFFDKAGTDVNIGKYLMLSGSYKAIALEQAFSTTRGLWYFSNLGDDAEILGKWNHLCIMYDNSDVGNVPTLFLNGTKRDITITSNTPEGTAKSDAEYKFTIGNRLDAARGFNGNITRVMLYDRILSDSERQRNYNIAKKEMLKVGVIL